MIPRNFDSITKADIDSLITDGVNESKTLDYKQELPKHSDAAKREFLFDVSSFANAAGGDIIYGIKEAVDNGKNTGSPDSVVPIEGCTVDQAKLRLEEMIRNGIDPRPIVHIKEIDGWNDDGQGFVILVRIPQSIASPHMVTLKSTSRFYSRHSSGKYQLDIDELRMAFLATESQGQRVRDFLLDRISRIRSDDTPVQLKAPDRIVLHLIPTSFFLSGRRLQLPDYNELIKTFSPTDCGGNGHRYNLDGFLTFAGPPPDRIFAYCQIMFNGCVEFVKADVTHPHNDILLVDDILRFEGYTDRLYEFFNGLKELDVPPPFVVHAAVLGCSDGVVNDGSFRFDPSDMGIRIHKFGKDIVLLPEAILDEFPQDDNHLQTMLKTIGDGLFNASGMPCHNNYDEKGNWKTKT